MESNSRYFSHVYTFTEYMKKVVSWFSEKPSGMKILDIPAGAGQMREALSEYGHEVICGDINREMEDYVFVDMNEKLPFPDNHFDAVICLEGVEHVINPVFLIEEIVRITKAGGNIVISMPNITNMYSRLCFLFTGIFYQFNPVANGDVISSDKKDRGHISPLTYWQLSYLLDYYGAKIIGVDGDKYKKKILLPIYLPIAFLGNIIIRKLCSANNRKDNQKKNEFVSNSCSLPVLLSRSIIVYFEKQKHQGSESSEQKR